MTYIILALFCILLAGVLIKFFRIPFHSPSIIFLAGYALSFILSAIGLLSWNTEWSLSITTMIALVTGILFFCFGDLLSKAIIKKQNVSAQRNQIGDKITIKKIVFVLSLFVFVGTIFLVIKELKTICATNNCSANSLSDMVYYFRSNSSLFSSNALSFSFITSQLIKMCNVLMLIYIYAFFNTLLLNGGIKKAWFYILPAPLFGILCLLQSGRGVLMVYIVAAIVIFSFLFLKKNADNLGRAAKKLAILLSTAIIAVLILFYSISPLLGRPARTSLVDYVSFYFGCSAPSLNIAARNGVDVNSNYFGENTFRGVYNALDKIGLIDYKAERSLPFVNLSGHYSNVYTSVFRSYYEFGILAVAILSLVSGLAFGALHSFVIKKNDYRLLIVYALIASSILDMFRDETFFTNVLSTTTIANVLYIFAITSVICKVGKK